MILSTHGIVGSQIQSFVGLLDTYPNAAAAYSVRKLRSAYTGNAIRVRRTDLTESNIGFTAAGNLDTTALLAFTGTGALDNGFITTWYDQSGNARNATQTTALNQPQIVSSGSVITENGKPASDWNGSMNLQANGLSSIINGNDLPISSFSVYKQDRTNFTEEIFAFGKNGAGISNYYLVRNNISGQYRNVANDGSTSISLVGGTTNTNQILRTDLKKSTTLDVFVDSSVVINNQAFDFGTFSGLNEFTIGNWEEGGFLTGFDGKMQEMILWDSDKSSNRTGIETNINDFYTIY
jgi:hypothetical protein